jgi:hypothetical protein
MSGHSETTVTSGSVADSLAERNVPLHLPTSLSSVQYADADTTEQI